MMDVPQKAAAVFVGVGLTLGGTAIAAELVAQSDYVRFRDVSIPDRPCRTESGPAPCFWDAGARGNGRGNSFWLVRQGERVRVHYLDPRADDREPYGGCDEAYRYPESPGAAWCRDHEVWKPFRDVEGHTGCRIIFGPTSYVRCEDGWRTSS